MKPSHRIQRINAAVLVREPVVIDPETGAETTVPTPEDTMKKLKPW